MKWANLVLVPCVRALELLPVVPALASQSPQEEYVREQVAAG
ncbi:MAG: hypothetical protein ACUVXF_12915 [Desulfobaccales bacterium]